MPTTKEHTTPKVNEDISIDVTQKQKAKTWFKRLGWATIIFFVVKGTISTLLILFAGKEIWEAIFG